MSETGRLETMEPNPVWVRDAYADTVDTLARYRTELDYHIWGGDWCKDCRAQLPDFGAALEAAEVPDARIHHYPTEKQDDGSKTGPGVEEYGIEYIPTVVVEYAPRSGDTSQAVEEIARFVEEEPVPIAVHLADQIESAMA
ncbi:thioredoxin [Haloarcula sp. S1CR25-12]|uniref:Thioredoxin n=1 Tax=Haloarcula saliterrae TaxID=2950534 RepID=A0ABU2F8F7_9EURY|nr:thioredoxin [Haloarcula sp. S1CR25-12]MDS0258198.1 thioredoxin [Haloarcula sp. S1CR25-12]